MSYPFKNNDKKSPKTYNSVTLQPQTRGLFAVPKQTVCYLKSLAVGTKLSLFQEDAQAEHKLTHKGLVALSLL